jgi:hypothetical protein
MQKFIAAAITIIGLYMIAILYVMAVIADGGPK